MTPEELEAWAEDFEAFHARFAPVFVRSEPREQAAKYLRGLLAPIERKNGWQVAEAVGDATPDRTQRLLYRAKWDADAARVVVETLGHPEGIGVVDETGFLKKGTKSVGVKRQYTGTAGKVENCQIGIVAFRFHQQQSLQVNPSIFAGVIGFGFEAAAKTRPESPQTMGQISNRFARQSPALGIKQAPLGRSLDHEYHLPLHT